MKVVLRVELDLIAIDPDTELADTDEVIEPTDMPELAYALEAHLKPHDDNYSSPDFLDGSGLFVGVTNAKVTLESAAPQSPIERFEDGTKEQDDA